MAGLKTFKRRIRDLNVIRQIVHENRLRIDYVLVYNMPKNSNEKGILGSRRKSRAQYRKAFLDNLKSSGVDIHKIVEDDHTVFILIHTPFAKLLEIAERTKFKMPIEKNLMDSRNMIARLLKKDDENEEKTIKYFTAPYSSDLHDKFVPFFNHDDIEATFSPTSRSLLTYELLCRTSFSKSEESDSKSELVGIERLLANDTFQAGFPLHEEYQQTYKTRGTFNTRRQQLWNDWACPKRVFHRQPLRKIREYFGEKIAFYFAWLGFYTEALIWPSMFGFFVVIYGFVTLSSFEPIQEICDENGVGNTTMCPQCDQDYCQVWKLSESCFYSKLTYLIDNPATVVYSFLMAIWTVLFIDLWKRRQSSLQFKWDTYNYEKSYEPNRPQYELSSKNLKLNPFTGVHEPYTPLRVKVFRYCLSVSTIVLMLLLILAFVLAVIIYRIVLKTVLSRSEETRPYSSSVVSITSGLINLIIIILLSKFYAWVSVKLTDWENHRTDSSYEDSLTIKMYLFQFVNFYGSVFYIAFFKGRNFNAKIGEFDLIEKCDPSGCMFELFTQLLIIMAGKQFLNGMKEALFPILQNRFKAFIKKKDNKKLEKSQWVKDLNLIKWDHLTLFQEYLEMVIQYGFMTLFIVGFPLGSIFAFLNNIIEIRIDAFKIMTQHRRPLPKKTQDIGAWAPILNVVSKLGIITNAFIIAFTSDFIPKLVYFVRNNGKLDGFIKYSLSVRNLTDSGVNNAKVELCSYRDFREPYNSPNKYEYTTEYFVVLGARLTFIVCFEHIVLLFVGGLHTLIPDIPKKVQDQIEVENMIKQQALWKPNTRVSHQNSFKRKIVGIEQNDEVNPDYEKRVLRAFNQANVEENESDDEYNEDDLGYDEDGHNDDNDIYLGRF